MLYFVLVILTYEIFSALQAEFYKQGTSSAVYERSPLERKIFSNNSNLDLIFSISGTIARINGIAFLIYLGYKTTWWHPVAIWVLGLMLIMLVSKTLKNGTGFTIPALLSFLVLPTTAAYLWYAV